jgi:hypothetical protein
MLAPYLSRLLSHAAIGLQILGLGPAIRSHQRRA